MVRASSVRCFAAAGALLTLASCSAAGPRPDGPAGIETEVDLGRWGLERADDVGYVKLTVTALPDGPKLSVQRVGAAPPPKIEPGFGRSSPEWSDDAFVIARFARPDDNRVGGIFNGFQRAPSRAEVRHSPEGRLQLDYDRREDGWAGLWIHLFDDVVSPEARSYLDAREASHLVFDVRTEGEGTLSIRLADRQLEMIEDSVAVGPLSAFRAPEPARDGWSRVRVPIVALPEGLDASRLAALVFLVDTPGVGRLRVRDLGLVREGADLIPPPETTTSRRRRPLSRGSVTPRVARPAVPRALWVWVTEDIVADPEERRDLLSLVERWRITDVYLQVPRDGLAATTVDRLRPLRSLLEDLHGRGVRVDALDGHPEFVLAEHHPAVLGTVRAVAEYNAQVPEEARFTGVRFDNEPYLLPGFFSEKKTAILRQYVELFRAIRPIADGAGLTVGSDIPFWFDGRDRDHRPMTALDARPFSEVVIDLVDNVTLMDYRTMAHGPDGVIAHAASELRYASQVGKKVQVGLETIWLPDERIYDFQPGTRGERLAILPGDPGRARLVWFGRGSGEAFGRFILDHPSARLLAAHKVADALASKLTFHGRSPFELLDVLAEAEAQLREHDAFSGFAFHCFRGLRDLDKARRIDDPAALTKYR